MSPLPPPIFSNSDNSDKNIAKEETFEPVNVSNVRETVEHLTREKNSVYSPPKPRFKTITLIATIVSVTVWVACVILALLQERTQLLQIEWLPSGQTLRMIGWIVLVGSIFWAIGMIWAVAVHNRKKLGNWINEVYGFELPKEVLLSLSLEDMKVANLFNKNNYYCSESVNFESPEAVHKLAVVVDEQGDSVLLDLNTGTPMKPLWEMYESYVFNSFAKDLWREKNRVTYTAFTVTPKGKNNAFAILVWSDDSLLKEWLNEALEVGLINEEQLQENYILEGTINDLYAQYDWMLEEYEDCRERGLVFGINWDEVGRGLLLPKNKLNDLITTGVWDGK